MNNTQGTFHQIQIRPSTRFERLKYKLRDIWFQITVLPFTIRNAWLNWRNPPKTMSVEDQVKLSKLLSQYYDSDLLVQETFKKNTLWAALEKKDIEAAK